MLSHRMNFWSLTIKIMFLSQTTAGILGNFSLLFCYIVHYGKHTLKPTDLILMNLMAANALIILSAGVPNTIAAFGLKQFLNDFKCRLILCIQRISRGGSIGTTCLLSVYQAMTISPRESCCKVHNVKAVKCICCSIAVLWGFYMLINFIFLVYTFVKKNSKNVTRKQDFGYCFITGRDEINDSLYAALVMCPEFFFSALMAYSSGSMIIILYRHKERVQHIRSTHGSIRNSPESTATQNILTLVSTFLAFYTLSSVLRGCIAILYNHSWWLANITRFTSLCFPCFGPFVLINHYSIVPRLSSVWIRNKNHLIFFK
ncbi:vomeronasal type-1 receptor 4-like [Onychomys torridus]|uniref:vomeronasal type-1 receptor 4-like n=1 Tax=Onychomys torridus TaxID=38674 RepID=UPI00167F89FD|nr:vomeronasal type-1 receptor 4-like [Onychomys torridus]